MCSLVLLFLHVNQSCVLSRSLFSHFVILMLITPSIQIISISPALHHTLTTSKSTAASYIAFTCLFTQTCDALAWILFVTRLLDECFVEWSVVSICHLACMFGFELYECAVIKITCLVVKMRWWLRVKVVLWLCLNHRGDAPWFLLAAD